MYLYHWISLDIMDIVVILAYKFDYCEWYWYLSGIKYHF